MSVHRHIGILDFQGNSKAKPSVPPASDCIRIGVRNRGWEHFQRSAGTWIPVEVPEARRHAWSANTSSIDHKLSEWASISVCEAMCCFLKIKNPLKRGHSPSNQGSGTKAEYSWRWPLCLEKLPFSNGEQLDAAAALAERTTLPCKGIIYDVLNS